MGNRITIMDVARKAGVSKGAVSLALNNSPEISKATAERIQAIARELDYKPIHRQAKKNRQNWGYKPGSAAWPIPKRLRHLWNFCLKKSGKWC